MSECKHGKAFPIGGLGDGSIVFIDLESGKVRGYNNDYTDIEEIAESFSKLILDLVEQVESCSLYNMEWYHPFIGYDYKYESIIKRNISITILTAKGRESLSDLDIQ